MASLQSSKQQQQQGLEWQDKKNENKIVNVEDFLSAEAAVATIKYSMPNTLIISTMFRALSKRKGLQMYEKLGEVHSIPETPTSTGLPETRASELYSSTPPAGGAEAEEIVMQGNSLPAKLAKKASKNHPLFGLLDGRRKKKTTARPELVRYLAYVKEGGVWDANSSNPVT